MTSQIGPIRASLTNTPTTEQDAREVADRSVRTWGDIHAVLSPIIGNGGVLALYQRSLHLTRAEHPGVALVPAADAPTPWQGLHTVLGELPAQDARAVSETLARTFCDLLGALIGTALTQRLLEGVPDLPLSGTAAPEASS